MVNLDKTLEQIDRQEWKEPTFNSHLVKTIYQLRKKPLKDFSTEDLRIFIGQNFNLEILIPIAIEKLQEDILAEGRFYEGDLLKSVLDSDSNFWTNNKEQWLTVKKLYRDNEHLFESDSIFKQIKKSFECYEKI